MAERNRTPGARRGRADVGVVIAGGGSGKRMGGSLPKQFLLLRGRTILERTVALFNDHPDVREIIVVVPRSHLETSAWIVHNRTLRKVVRVVAGGDDRQASVWNGLNAFREPPRLVLVHDAVRPLVRRDVVDAVIRQAGRHGAAVAAVRVKETIKLEGQKGYFTKTLDRARLWTIQTPQGFRFGHLYAAHKKAREDGFRGTDDASLVERARRKIRIVEGDYENVKITTGEDLAFAEMVLGKKGIERRR
jgi:2-C-methyl-D-erythritol 4-phosphate cytidylyltransferase